MGDLQTQILDLAHTGSARMKNRNPFLHRTKWARRITDAEEAEAIHEVAESGDSREQDKLADYFYRQGNLTAYVELLCRAAKLGDSDAQRKLNVEIDSGDHSERIAMLYEVIMQELYVEDDRGRRYVKDDYCWNYVKNNYRLSRDDAEHYYEDLIDMLQETGE